MDKIQIRAIFLDALLVARKRVVYFAFLGLLGYSPFLVRIAAHWGETSISDPSLEFQVLGLVLSQLLSGVIAYGTIAVLKGRPATLGTTLRLGTVHILPIVAVGLLSSMAVFALSFAPILFAPAIFATIVLYVALPVYVAEQPGIIDSLYRSAELTRGQRWTIFSILLLQVIAMLIGTKILSLLFGDPSDVLTATYLACVLGLQLFIGIFGSILSGVTYFHLAAFPDKQQISFH